jgi:Ala-tRNA(Pro) deacylase
VLPATKRVDLQRLSHCLGDSHLELATEGDVAKHCPDCEVGVLPPFGSQYGLNTVMDESLSEDGEIVFEANNHHEAIRMKVSDFRFIEQPLVCSFAK